ncbi:MAG: hypothetical protein AMXMBFR37_07210 [Steroidobacteraceae bacterium]
MHIRRQREFDDSVKPAPHGWVEHVLVIAGGHEDALSISRTIYLLNQRIHDSLELSNVSGIISTFRDRIDFIKEQHHRCL